MKNLFCSRKAQVTIFVIIAIGIVLIIGLFFLIRSQTGPEIEKNPEKNPEFSLNNCISPKIKNLIREISENGGYKEIRLLRTYNQENYSYLCYTDNYYTKCINQNPMLIQHLRQEIKENIQADVEACFQDLKFNLEEQGFRVDMQAMNLNVELMPSRVLLDIDRTVEIYKTGQNRQFQEFKITESTKIYDLAIVAQEITSQEAEYCNFDHLGYMLAYTKFEIDKIKLDNGDLIYYVRDKKTKEEFRFAIKTCIMPGGF